MVKKVEQELNNKLVMYICSKEWDTPLDMKVIQRKRIQELVAQSDCEIVAVFGDGELKRAFEYAYDISGRVIVADLSRLADRTVDYLEIAEDETKNFVDASASMPNCKPSLSKDMLKLVWAMSMAAREAYLTECNKWLT